MHDWDDEVDVAVFGSGAGGMSAALVCAHHGLRVALFEKSAWLGGTTANSGGGVWAPANTLAQKAGLHDSLDAARRYLQAELGEHYRADLSEAFLESAGAAIDWLAANTEVRFQLTNLPDYHAEQPGGLAHGRTLFPEPFDGRQLGQDFALLRKPWDRFMVLGGMMIGRREIPALLSPFASLANLRKLIRMLTRYACDRLRYPRGTQLLIGNALAARFLFSLRKCGVSIQVETPLVELLKEGSTVIGALVRTPAGLQRIRARCAVVLATGGFPHSEALRKELSDATPHHLSAACDTNTGDGLSIARAVGADIDRSMGSAAFWTPASLVREESGTVTVLPYGHLDRGKPGAIIVDAHGRRFVNEADSYHDVVTAMFAGPDREARQRSHLICDHRFIRRYGLGAIRPRSMQLERMIRDGYLVRGATIAELASKIGVEATQLEQTITRHNGFAREGIDRDFGKGSTCLNRYNGDPDCTPNPCLRPLSEPPFYALALHAATLGTAIGLRTDANARVLNTHHQAIEGLYACGNDMASFARGYYPAGGITLGPAIVFGYRAARHIARAC